MVTPHRLLGRKYFSPYHRGHLAHANRHLKQMASTNLDTNNACAAELLISSHERDWAPASMQMNLLLYIAQDGCVCVCVVNTCRQLWTADFWSETGESPTRTVHEICMFLTAERHKGNQCRHTTRALRYRQHVYSDRQHVYSDTDNTCTVTVRCFYCRSQGTGYDKLNNYFKMGL
jgi:hypothetical protein